MSDYISREAVNALIKAECSPKVAAYLIDAVATIPAADVRPVVRGKWEHTEDFDEYGGGRYVEWTCSECFFKVKGDWAVRDSHIDEKPRENFCPNCGADMRPTSMSGANGEES